MTCFSAARRRDYAILKVLLVLSATCACDTAFADHCVAERQPYTSQMRHGPDWDGAGKTSCKQIDVYIANDEIFMSQVQNRPDCQHDRTMSDPVLAGAVDMTVNRLRRLRERKAQQCSGDREERAAPSDGGEGLDPMSCISLRQLGYHDLYLHARVYSRCSYKVTAYVKECDGEGTDHLICRKRAHNISPGGQSDDISSEKIEPKLVGAIAVGRR